MERLEAIIKKAKYKAVKAVTYLGMAGVNSFCAELISDDKYFLLGTAAVGVGFGLMALKEAYSGLQLARQARREAGGYHSKIKGNLEYQNPQSL